MQSKTFVVVLSAWLLAVLCTLVSPGLQAQVYSTAGFYAVDGSPRAVQSFNPGWRFYQGDAADAQTPGFDDSQWEAANLPHGLEILGENLSGNRNYQGVAWYRKRFDARPDGANGRVYLYFEAVMGTAEVWVNGQKVAEHFGGYLPFAADVTDALKPDGKHNLVAVKANNAGSKLYPPGQPQGRMDFSYLGGIYRDSYLIFTGPVHATLPVLSDTVAGGGVFAATLDVNGRDAQIEVRTQVVNTASRSANVTVKSILKDAEGKTVAQAEESIELPAGQTRQLTERIQAKNVRLWHPDDPYLHFVQTEIEVDGRLVDSLKTRLGIRLFEMRGPQGLYVNKKPLGKKLVGANRHQDYPYVGNALPNSGQWRDVKLLRAGGCSVIRAAHYPMDPAFYDACDALGVMTTTALPGWHFYNFKDKVFEERVLADARNLVRRDRQVASMLMWEMTINEYPKQPAETMRRMHAITHEEIPFPSVYTVADNEMRDKGGLDIYYNHTDPKVNSFQREYGDGSEVDNWYSQNAYTRVKPEWGEEALTRQSLKQANTLSFLYGNSSTVLGGAIWCGIDHQRGYHPDPFRGGLVDLFRIPRFTYYLYKSQYDPGFEIPGAGNAAMVFIAHENTQVSGQDIVVYSNCEQVRLTFLGKEIATLDPVSTGQKSKLLQPPFIFKNVFNFYDIRKAGDKRSTQEALMVAEGLIDGKVVARHERPYGERTTGLKLELDDLGVDLVADGADFVPVRASVIDQFGNKKVLASEYVHFVVEGPAEVIGGAINHANPKRTERGVATALIRAGTQPGSITIKAYCQGLESAEITIESKRPGMRLALDAEYAQASRKRVNEGVVVIKQAGAANSDLPTDVKTLQAELEKVHLELIGKDQDIMELKAQLGASTTNPSP